MNAAQRSILIVEDERIVARDLQQTLRDLGYDAYASAPSSEEAIARAAERCPDLVLMDIRIKGELDGIELAAILRERFGVPVVYLTAHADEVTIARAKLTEPHGYLLKPVRPRELRSAIEVSLYRYQMERRLRERKRWFSTTLQSIADAVITVDLGGRITFMNSTAEMLVGVKQKDCLDRPARDVLQLADSEARPLAEIPLERALRERRPVAAGDAELIQPGDASRTISETAAPLVDENQMLGAVMVFRDVTDERMSRRRLELSDRLGSLGTMAAGVANEMNDPLAVVVANAAYVRDEMAAVLLQIERGDGRTSELLPRLREAIDAQLEIQSSALRIGEMVSDLRLFSRPASDAHQEASVAQATDRAIRTTAHEFLGRARVVTDIAEVPAVALDETRFGQVLVNLLINAAHSIPPGDLDRNEVVVKARTDPQGRVVIEVRDTGCGMPADVVKRVFEPFFTTRPSGLGTGLGLAICHGIVTSVGGAAEVESQPGAGSVLRIVLPSAAAARNATEPHPAAPACEQRGRVLVVDDEALVRRSLCRTLRDHDVVEVGGAREALKLLTDGETFDVILSDLVMPDMTGMEFYEELLRKRPEDARRVFFLTGGAATPRIADFLAAVPNPRMEKPFDVVRLRSLVQQMLESSPTGRAPTKSPGPGR